jgi:hypothetical protein
MHFHLPKPLQGWREFAGEVGIIVLGVLIALTAQEGAQALRDRGDAAQLRQSMTKELANDRARWEANHHDVPCALRQLDSVSTWAARPGSDRIVNFGGPTMWTMHDSAWQIARSSPVMTSLTLNERDSFASLYFALEFQQREMEKALDSLIRVRALAKTADKPVSRNALPAAAAEAQGAIKLFDGNFSYVEKRFDELHIRSSRRSDLGAEAVNYPNGCPPLAPVPSGI